MLIKISISAIIDYLGLRDSNIDKMSSYLELISEIHNRIEFLDSAYFGCINGADSMIAVTYEYSDDNSVIETRPKRHDLEYNIFKIIDKKNYIRRYNEQKG